METKIDLEKCNCNEIKLNLIKNILEIDDCKEFAENYKITTIDWFTPPFDGEITEVSKINEVAERIKNIPSFPPEFIIESIEKVFKDNMFSTYFHIYFIKNNNGISLLFRFNNNATNIPAKFDVGEILYELKGTKLTRLNNYVEAAEYINKFEIYHNSINSVLVITQYVTFYTKSLVENFNGFAQNTKLISGVKKDIKGNSRLNIILEIDTVYCKKTTLATGSNVYYNIGNMQP